MIALPSTLCISLFHSCKDLAQLRIDDRKRSCIGVELANGTMIGIHDWPCWVLWIKRCRAFGHNLKIARQQGEIFSVVSKRSTYWFVLPIRVLSPSTRHRKGGVGLRFKKSL